MDIYPPNRRRIIFERKSVRRIDHEYAIELTAYNSQQMVQAQTQILHLQAATAVANLRMMSETAQRQAEIKGHLAMVHDDMSTANDHLSAIQDSVEVIARNLDKFQIAMDDVNTNLQLLDETVASGFSMIADVLNTISTSLFQQTKQLADISHELRHPYKAQAGELRDKAKERIIQELRTENASVSHLRICKIFLAG